MALAPCAGRTYFRGCGSYVNLGSHGRLGGVSIAGELDCRCHPRGSVSLDKIVIMKLKPWKTLSSEVINQNAWSSFIHNEFETPDGRKGDYYYMKTPAGSVMVVPVLADGRLVLHREYRYVFNRISLAFPSGGIQEGQTALEAVRAELKEESGYVAKSIEKVGELAPSTGILHEYTTYFFAHDLEEGESEPEPFEEFEKVLMTVEEVDEAIASGEVWDGFTVCAWQLMRERVLNYRNQL